MDLNGDGKIDILSGSYSRHDSDMAGLFQVLWGAEGGTFEAAQVLEGTDGEPLIITVEEKDVTSKICTRPTAVDLDGDGNLDIVSGNFTGTFAFFAGEGEGKFAPNSTWLTTDGTPLRVDAHSDPFFVDWDSDGDLDLITGSSAGGVFLSTNGGTAKEAKLSKPVALVEPVGHDSSETRLGDGHLTGPQSSTRVWVDDLNGDGKLDLLVGDSVTLHYPAADLDEATVRSKLAAWEKKQQQLLETQAPDAGGQPSANEMQKFQEDYAELHKERETFLRSDMTGFVWVYYQK